MFFFTPLPGFFSPFPHGTRSLSVIPAYLALEDGPPRFKQGFSCPALLTNNSTRPPLASTGLSPAPVRLSSRLQLHDDFLTRAFPIRGMMVAVQPHTLQRLTAYIEMV